ncbi:MAG: hypothetical protein E2598_10275 [Sphingobium sp.]|nr:hypothetical protein [Sphingobium sp.]
MQHHPIDAIAAIDDSGSVINYGELVSRASALAHDIGEQRRLILLEGGQTIDWLVAYVACLIGRHPCLIFPAGNIHPQQVLDETFLPSVWLTSRDAYRAVHRNDREPISLHEDLAVLLSTSGSTGSAKCVRLSQQNITANAAAIAEYLGLSSKDHGVVNLPTHYSYGLSIVNSHLYTGGRLLLTSRSVSEPAFWDFCTEHSATSFAGVPHIYELLQRVDLAARAPKTLRYFTQAGGRLKPELVKHFEEIARKNGWSLVVMYGQTEATARMAYMPSAQLRDHPDCIGIAVPGGRFSLVGDDDAVISADETDGELIYEGPNVMMGYALSPADMALPAGPARLPTGDIARRTADGFYRITGRKSRFVKIFGNRIGLDDVEHILTQQGHDSIATGIDDQLLIVTRDADASKAIEGIIRAELKLPKEYFQIQLVDDYPRLASGKTDYASLKKGLQPPGVDLPNPSAKRRWFSRAQPANKTETVVDIYRSVFGEKADDEGANFRSLGGDSLNYVVTALALERLIAKLPEEWDTLSIATLTEMASEPDNVPNVSYKTSPIMKIDTVRGLACLLIVAFHFVGASPKDGMRLPDNSIWRYVIDSTVMLRLPIFTVIAGYLYGAMPVVRGRYGEFLLRKARQLLIPMLFVMFVYIALRYMKDGRQEDILWAILGGYRHLWYLEILFIMFVIVGVADIVFKNKNFMLIAMTMMSVVLTTAISTDDVFHFDSTFFLFPFFLFGLALYRNQNLLKEPRVLILALLTTLGTLAFQQASMLGYLPEINWRILRPSEMTPLVSLVAWLCGCAATVALLHMLPRISLLEKIAAYSFTIYLWHPAASDVVRKAFNILSIKNDWIVLFGGVAIAVIIPICMHIAVARYPKISWLVTGR